MCYDVSYLTKKAAKYAQHYGAKKDWEHIMKRLPPVYHVSGFDEPQLPAVTAEHEGIVALDWPFLPISFTPIASSGRPLNTLNARDDRIFTEKSMYRESADHRRCVIFLDGFFDHHKKGGVVFPYYIKDKEEKPLAVAGLWQIFQNTRVTRECATIVTTRANKEMGWIHNEPAYSPESRMIAVLDDPEKVATWLFSSVPEAKEVVGPLPDDTLEYYPCKPVKANKKLKRTYLGNVPEIQERAYYPELEESQGSLF